MAQLLRDFVRVENDFTIIPNEILRNKEMKSSVKNILLTMFSLPPDWDFSIAGISACVAEGRDTVQKSLIELEKIGYITRKRERKANGTLGAMIYTIHQFPVPEEKNTYKNNFSNQDTEKPEQAKPKQENPTLDSKSQLRTDNILNNDNELNNDYKLRTDKYALKDKSFKDLNMYASVSEKQEVEPKPSTAKPNKKSRYIPKDYTEEQLREHIKPVTDRYIDENSYRKDKDELKNNILEIISEFHREYEKNFGEKHKILADVSYENIAERFLNPPEIMADIYYVEAYSAMIEQYFIVEFNKRKKYKKPIEISLSHFMSDEIRGHLYWQTCV